MKSIAQKNIFFFLFSIIVILMMGIFIPCCGSSASSESDASRDGGVVTGDLGNGGGGGVGEDEIGKLRLKVLEEYDAYKAKSFANVPDISVDALPIDVVNSDDLNSGEYVLVDCRTSAEQAVSMLPGALSKDEFEADPQKYASRRVIVYCTIGYRSGLYTRDLKARGIDAVNLKGGVLAWAIAGRSFVGPRTGSETKRVHVYGRKWDLLPPGYEAVY